MKRFIRLNEEEEEYDEYPEGNVGQDGLEVAGVDFLPMATGVLNSSGEMIVRHPMVIRMGFYTEENKYHFPTKEEGEFPGSQRVFGWMYDLG